MNNFLKYLNEKIDVSENSYRKQIFKGESPEFLRGFDTGYLLALLELRNNYRDELEK